MTIESSDHSFNGKNNILLKKKWIFGQITILGLDSYFPKVKKIKIFIYS